MKPSRRMWGLGVIVGLLMLIPLAQAKPEAGLTPQVYLPIIRTSCHDYFDGFGDPDSGWPVGPVVLNNQQLGLTDYVNGEYYMHIDQAGAGYLFRPIAPAPLYENYVVEADAHFDLPTADGLYGLVFGAVVEDNEVPRYYLFEVEPETQEFRLIRREDGVSTDIVDYTLSTAIHTGAAANHLVAVHQGDQITLAVNGVTLGTWTDSALPGPASAGLAFRVRSTVPQANSYFDNFHLHICVPGMTSAAPAFNQAGSLFVVDTSGIFGE